MQPSVTPLALVLRPNTALFLNCVDGLETAFLAQHESYHIVQMALLRRQLELPAMTYALRAREPGRRGA
ncbi:MAG: hypothetical protein ACHQ2E_02190 [Gemmatimonadales bacterium]